MVKSHEFAVLLPENFLYKLVFFLVPGGEVVLYKSACISRICVKAPECVIYPLFLDKLFGNIFFKNTPLHDGAVIMRDGIILAAACFLPKPEKEELINKALGSRHRAAIGMSENSDAIIIVVSEETGAISVAENGELTRGYSKDTLKKTLRAKLLPEKTPKEKSQDKQSKEGTKSEKLGLINKNKKG